ncbi:MAG: exodeoxyribonuclease VII small subunit [Alphaproteobacteria bacterium]|jgi:exodeoxyribonuclease VII small subunit
MNDKITFEKALTELEEIVRQLESGDIELDDAILAYERGAKLKDFCTKKLNEAKQRIDKIKVDGDTVTTESFDG